MIVEFGNVAPLAAGTEHGEPCVTTFRIPDGVGDDEALAIANATDIMRHLAQNPSITRLPGLEGFLDIQKIWANESAKAPSWVWSDNRDMERLCSDYWDCPRGRPGDVEATHHTVSGPPGVGPEPEVAP